MALEVCLTLDGGNTRTYSMNNVAAVAGFQFALSMELMLHQVLLVVMLKRMDLLFHLVATGTVLAFSFTGSTGCTAGSGTSNLSNLRVMSHWILRCV